MNHLGDWLAPLRAPHPKNIDLGLERVQAVAQRLDLRFECPSSPSRAPTARVPPAPMLEAIALQAGYRTGVYTSPHLVHFEERCRIAARSCRRRILLPHFERVEAAARQGA
jgi:dihydrofolate synthase/folylpolyglutamate synthase